MVILQGLKYSKEHEWIKVEGNKAYIGITDYAQHALGDLVYVELPEIVSQINAGDTLSVVESVKAASDIYAPVSGTVVEVNEELEKMPENINAAPYESWIAVIELRDMEELKELMDADEYETFCEGEA